MKSGSNKEIPFLCERTCDQDQGIVSVPPVAGLGIWIIRRRREHATVAVHLSPVPFSLNEETYILILKLLCHVMSFLNIFCRHLVSLMKNVEISTRQINTSTRLKRTT